MRQGGGAARSLRRRRGSVRLLVAELAQVDAVTDGLSQSADFAVTPGVADRAPVHSRAHPHATNAIRDGSAVPARYASSALCSGHSATGRASGGRASPRGHIHVTRHLSGSGFGHARPARRRADAQREIDFRRAGSPRQCAALRVRWSGSSGGAPWAGCGQGASPRMPQRHTGWSAGSGHRPVGRRLTGCGVGVRSVG